MIFYTRVHVPFRYKKIDGRESAVHLMYHAYPGRRRGIETILNTAYEEALNEMRHDLTEVFGQQNKRRKTK